METFEIRECGEVRCHDMPVGRIEVDISHQREFVGFWGNFNDAKAALAEADDLESDLEKATNKIDEAIEILENLCDGEIELTTTVENEINKALSELER